MKVEQSISIAFYILIMFANSRHCLINTGCSSLQWFVILGMPSRNSLSLWPGKGGIHKCTFHVCSGVWAVKGAKTQNLTQKRWDRSYWGSEFLTVYNKYWLPKRLDTPGIFLLLSASYSFYLRSLVNPGRDSPIGLAEERCGAATRGSPSGGTLRMLRAFKAQKENIDFMEFWD